MDCGFESMSARSDPAAQAKTELCKGWQALFALPLSDFEIADEAHKEAEACLALWTTLKDFQEHVQACTTEPMLNVSNEVSHSTTYSHALCTRSSRRLSMTTMVEYMACAAPAPIAERAVYNM